MRLAKGARSRLAEDELASRLLLRAAAAAMGVGAQGLELGLLPVAAGPDPGDGGVADEGMPAEQLSVEHKPFDSSMALADLINGRVSTVEFSGEQAPWCAALYVLALLVALRPPQLGAPRMVLPLALQAATCTLTRRAGTASTCPAHSTRCTTATESCWRHAKGKWPPAYLPACSKDGFCSAESLSAAPPRRHHCPARLLSRLQAACRCKPGLEGAFELSIGNADKGLLPLAEIQQRVAQFTAAGLPLVVTQASMLKLTAGLIGASIGAQPLRRDSRRSDRHRCIAPAPVLDASSAASSLQPSARTPLSAAV